MIARGEVYWVDLGMVAGSAPAKRRPVVIVQSDAFTATRLATVIVAAISTNLALAEVPGNVFLSAATSGLPRDSVVNVTQLVTLDKTALGEKVGSLPLDVMRELDDGLALVLSACPG